MITEVILPKLGQTMEEGAIVDWVKEEGDPVARGDVLFTVESDKAVLEVEATARGYLRKILVPAGQMVPVLTVVGLITRQADEPLEGYGEAAAEQAPVEVARVQEPIPDSTREAAPRPEGRIFASPRARKAAQERGIDLAAVTGSGPNGRIVEQDVLDYAATAAEAAPSVTPPRATPVAVKTAEALGVDLAAVQASGPGQRITKADVLSAAPVPPAPAPRAAEAAPVPAAPEALVAERVPLAGVRRIVSERMAASHDQTARVTLVTEADATELVAARERLKASVSEEWGFAPGFNDLLALIVARALREFPYMNARLSQDGQAVERLGAVNLGLAVDTERGLLVPVIRDADQKGLRAFGAEFRELVERARVGRSLPDDLSGGTFTITNLGMYDIDAFTPIINLPEAAILGVGRIQAKPVVRDGEIVARHMWSLSLVFDHRLVDGAPAARFLQRIKQLVENPFLLLG
ncbi:MAG: 2-oxo acid dehydrogenase subunit E2 [Anaerolineae bacterium]|nr:2-oxo acid dehydrogenase subunit E2 [Anaerolineae bacterium]